jgi:tellurite resistance protein TehA-like permease
VIKAPLVVNYIHNRIEKNYGAWICFSFFAVHLEQLVFAIPFFFYFFFNMHFNSIAKKTVGLVLKPVGIMMSATTPTSR